MYLCTELIGLSEGDRLCSLSGTNWSFMCNLGEFQTCSRSHTPIKHQSAAWHSSKRIANSSELGTLFTNPLPVLVVG